MDNVEVFQYEALQLSEPSIRVIQILSSKSNDDSVQCLLREIPLQKTHTCLSYVWGDPSAERKIILVNGKQFGVLPNLWAFIHQAWEMGIEESIWIDAISINQKNKPERNSQVQKMPDIYQQARHVIVWPGQVECRKFKLTTEEIESFQLFNRDAGHVSGTEISEANLLHLALKRLFHNDLIRGYFDRLWILQEILLATRRSIIISGTMESWEDFAESMTSFWDQDAKWIKDDKLLNPEVTLVTVRHTDRPGMEENAILPRWLELLKLSVEPSRKLSTFSDLLATSYKSVCSEKRDHLYGLLGLIEGGRRFQVDYEQSKETIFLDALAYFTPKSGVDFSKEFALPYSYLNYFFETQIGALCKPCALEGHPGHINKDAGSEHNTSEISILDAMKTSLPVEFVMCPVESLEHLIILHEGFPYDGNGYCQSCRKGIFISSSAWPLVSIAFFRQSRERLWITVSKAKQPIQQRIRNRVQDFRDQLRLAFPAQSGGDGRVGVHVGKDTVLNSLYQASTGKESGRLVLPTTKKRM